METTTYELITAYACIIAAVIIFGTNFIPVKKVATGKALIMHHAK